MADVRFEGAGSSKALYNSSTIYTPKPIQFNAVQCLCLRVYVESPI